MVEEEHIRMAYERIDSERTNEVIKSLPLHSKLILIALLKVGGGSIQASKLYLLYKDICEKLGENPLSYRRFHGLITELSIMGIVARRIYNYGRRGGRISSIRLLSDVKDISSILGEDPLIGDLINI